MIPINERILISTYEDLTKEIKDPNLKFCPLEHIHEFFEANKNSDPYILVSAHSDYGIVYQNDEHPNLDLQKLTMRTDFSSLKNISRDSYMEVKVGPCCVKEKCNVKHKYGVKIDSWTDSTFDFVPKNVYKWFCTNLNVYDPKIEFIPFGLSNEGHGSTIIELFDKTEKDRCVYANFQNYCDRRLQLKSFIKNKFHRNHITFVEHATLPVEQFYKDIASHKFILCPPGNGKDCYRIAESLYLGSIPVVEGINSFFNRHWYETGVPIYICGTFEEFLSHEKEYYDQLYYEYSRTWESYKYDSIKRSYWKDRFLKTLKDLKSGS